MWEVIAWVCLSALILFLAFMVLCYFIFVNSGGYMVTLEKLIDDEDNS
jgi:hypothetical protein